MKNFKRILLVFTMLFTVVLTTACIKTESIDMFEKALVKYKGIEGLKADITYEGDTFVENVEIDYESIDYKKAQTVFGPSFKSPKEVKYTMKGIEKQLLDEGYVEQK